MHKGTFTGWQREASGGLAQGPEGREDGELGALGLQTGGRFKGRQGWGLWDSRLTKKLWVQPGGAAPSG